MAGSEAVEEIVTVFDMVVLLDGEVMEIVGDVVSGRSGVGVGTTGVGVETGVPVYS